MSIDAILKMVNRKGATVVSGNKVKKITKRVRLSTEELLSALIERNDHNWSKAYYVFLEDFFEKVLMQEDVIDLNHFLWSKDYLVLKSEFEDEYFKWYMHQCQQILFPRRQYYLDLFLDIKSNGIKEPILVHTYSPLGLEIDGNHRLSIAKVLREKYVPCVLIKEFTKRWKREKGVEGRALDFWLTILSDPKRRAKYRKEKIGEYKSYLQKFDEICLLPDNPNFAVDVGCGPFGGIASVYKAKRWILADPFNHRYLKNKNINKKHKIQYTRDSCERLSIEDETVDIVFCLDVLPYIRHSRIACFKEISRVLKNNGMFCMTYRDQKLDAVFGRNKEYSLEQVQSELEIFFEVIGVLISKKEDIIIARRANEFAMDKRED